MGISVVANFLDPTEAEIAAGALRSAGFNAMALDQHFAAMDSIARHSLGGMRVGVPEGEAAEATQFLRAIVADRPKHPARIQRGVGWRVAAVLLAILSPPFGWLVIGMAKARRRRTLEVTLAWFIFVALAVAGVIGLILIFTWLPGILYPNGRA